MTRIEPADLDDGRVIALLHAHLASARAGTAPGSAHALDVTGLRAPDIAVFAAWDGDTLLGIGAVRRLSATEGEVKSMYVAPASRGRGIGAAVLAHLVATARAAGLSRLSLETGSWAYFEPAHALYRRHGFVECPPFGEYRPDHNSVFMTRSLA